MDSFQVRVAARATSFSPVRALLTLLVAPLWLLGATASIVWMMLSWSWAAVQVGFSDVQARGRATTAPPAPPVQVGPGDVE